ncbi:MoaD/ThiS family protein [Nesterenkonia sp.]|uniref:MoaD/ThiS family protein n=1 Tax=Nesterenkonia sp. TaxID=704201 RepID=UPI0026108EED|nr:MoaD/ThiS family protein [Nesterenkonia sp.]
MSSTPEAQTSFAQPAPSAGTVTIRFFAAAEEAAGTGELTMQLSGAEQPLGEVLSALPEQLPPPQAGACAVASLSRVCARSSYLLNGRQARPETAVLRHGDQLDILPPFAGG